MNPDQIKGILRILGAYVGPPIVAWLVKLGVTPEQIGAFGNALINLVGAGVPIAMAVWSLYANSRKGKIKSVASMPEVKQVVVHPVDATMSGLIKDPAVPKVVAPESPSIVVGMPNL